VTDALATIAGQAVPQHRAARLIAGVGNATIDANGSPYWLFTQPPGAVTDPGHGT
jgi:hypothetical protein